MRTETDRIEKKTLLRAPQARVWQAISDARKFGSWFGMKLDGPFVAGAVLRGRIAPTTVDEDVAARQRPYEGKPVEITVDRIEAERLFSFRWHPYALEKDADYSSEPTTLVVFELETVDGGTMLTITESGFDGIPVERREKAFAANAGGWQAQLGLIEKYLAQTS